MPDQENEQEGADRQQIESDDFQANEQVGTPLSSSRWRQRQEELRQHEEFLREKLSLLSREVTKLSEQKEIILKEIVEAQKLIDAERLFTEKEREEVHKKEYALKVKEVELEVEKYRLEREKRIVETNKLLLESHLRKNDHELRRQAAIAERWQKRLNQFELEKREREESDLKYETKKAEIEQKRKELAERRQQHAKDVAEQQANVIRSKYGVNVEILFSNAIYYSEKTIARSVQENVFFISLESPHKTRMQTEYIISHLQAREKLRPNDHSLDLQERNRQLLDLAHAKRTEQANQKSAELSTTIDEIKKILAEKIGKEPSLHKIADMLNKEKIETPTGEGTWHAQTVKRVLERSKTAQRG